MLEGPVTHQNVRYVCTMSNNWHDIIHSALQHMVQLVHSFDPPKSSLAISVVVLNVHLYSDNNIGFDLDNRCVYS